MQLIILRFSRLPDIDIQKRRMSIWNFEKKLDFEKKLRMSSDIQDIVGFFHFCRMSSECRAGMFSWHNIQHNIEECECRAEIMS